MKITAAQKQVLEWHTKDCLTVAEIAKRRNCTHRAVYKILKKLQDQGFLQGFSMPKQEGILRAPPLQGGCEPSFPLEKFFRWHGVQLQADVLFKGEKYHAMQKAGRVVFLDGNTVVTYPTSIVVHFNHNFEGASMEAAESVFVAYLSTFLPKLEVYLKASLIKPGKQSIRVLAAHYAEVMNGIAKRVHRSGEKLVCRANEDGKVWLVVDFSFKRPELETLHSVTGRDDMVKVQRQLNDWRDNDPPTLSELMVVLGRVVNINKETAAGLNMVVQLLKPREERGGQVSVLQPDYVG